MPHGLFEEKVKITDEHRYFDVSGNEYLSFSRIYDEFICKPFNKELIARKTAESKNCTSEDVLNEWADKRDNGIRIDDAITCFNETGLVADSNADIKDIILGVSEEYKRYKKNFSQMLLYHEATKTAGTADRLFLFTHMKDANFGMSDFKVFEKDDLFKRNGWLNYPFDHLPATKFMRITFQLSFYAYLFEELTGRKCNELFIHVINPITRIHQKYYTPYIKNDIKLLLSTYKEEINALVNRNTIEEAF